MSAEPGTLQLEAGAPTTTASLSVIDATNLESYIHYINTKRNWVKPLTKGWKDNVIYSEQNGKEFAMTMYTKSTSCGIRLRCRAQANFTIPPSLLANLPTFRSWTTLGYSIRTTAAAAESLPPHKFQWQQEFHFPRALSAYSGGQPRPVISGRRDPGDPLAKSSGGGGYYSRHVCWIQTEPFSRNKAAAQRLPNFPRVLHIGPLHEGQKIYILTGIWKTIMLFGTRKELLHLRQDCLETQF